MRKTKSLNGMWRITGAAPDAETVNLYGKVPGEVHPALEESELIPDPFYGFNTAKVQWVEKYAWSYERDFTANVDGAKQVLRFEGLDTFASVYLNGELLGKTDNMFVPHEFDVTGMVIKGENNLRVDFEPAAAVAEKLHDGTLFGCFDGPRINIRKMQCSFGWDWTDRFVGAGIWRGVSLIERDAVNIESLRVEPEINGNTADVWVYINAENNTAETQPVLATVVIEGEDSRETVEIAAEVPPEGDEICAVIRIPEPKRWYPAGMGGQPLYRCMAALTVKGNVCDAAEKRFGIRDISIIERDEDLGERFTITVNGEEMFCKGGNWVPADHFVSRVTPEKYRELVTLAKDANFNMLRVWGGGIYEDESFYDVCDELGITVWQDFMFACADYPDTPEFNASVKDEITKAVKALRHHPCILLWSGNNECEMNRAPEDTTWPGRHIYYDIIPSVLRQEDNTRPYRYCCPWGGKIGNDPTVGDSHVGKWFDIAYRPAEEWRKVIQEDFSLFASEFPVQGCPQAESLRKFIPEELLMPPTGDIYEHKNKDNPHSGRTDGMTHQRFLVDITNKLVGDTDTAEKWADFGGVSQGIVLAAEIELYRSMKPKTSGCMFWMYNDCWPAVGWSVVDFYTRPKAAYYFVKRAYAPFVIAFEEREGKLRIHISSDSTEDFAGKLSVGVLRLDTSEVVTEIVDVKLPAGKAGCFFESENLDALLPEPENMCVVAVLAAGDETAAKNTYFKAPPRDVRFPRPKLIVQREQRDETTHAITLGAESYVRCLKIGNLPETARPSDNYFDLLPGERYTVTIAGLTADEAANMTLGIVANKFV
ncbi:MAG: glycoside hydrolase family 2 protein [Abditibacteriota bacterium]|nr:glycoside hydrolase family 2 protein [Abditibacteriota bacterium]